MCMSFTTTWSRFLLRLPPAQSGVYTCILLVESVELHWMDCGVQLLKWYSMKPQGPFIVAVFVFSFKAREDEMLSEFHSRGRAGGIIVEK